MKKVLTSVLLSLFVIFVAGCESETKQAQVVQKSPNKQERIKPLSLTTVEGKTIHLNLDNNVLVSDDLKGKVVLVNFFATWCPPCIKEIPTFNELYANYSDKFEIVAVLYERNKDMGELKAFIKEHNIKFPITVGENNFIAAKMFGNVQKVPESFIFSPEGFMLKKFVGVVNEEALEGFITGQAE